MKKSGETEFQAEETIKAKVLRHEYAWSVHGMAERLDWMELCVVGDGAGEITGGFTVLRRRCITGGFSPK